MPMDATAMGDAMYAAVKSIVVDQDSLESENLGKLRMRKMAEAIIDHITAQATISTILTTSTPAGAGPHIHAPITVETTGKIS